MAVKEGIKRAAERARGVPVRFVERSDRGDLAGGSPLGRRRHRVLFGPGRCLLMGVEGGSEPQFVAVLNEPPVDSPLAAVRSWIMSSKREQHGL